jgi:hypothetical protein
VLHLRRYEDADEPIVRRLHDEGMRQAGAHAGHGPWDDDLRAIRSTYLDDAGEFLLGELDGEVVAIGALRRVSQTTRRDQADARRLPPPAPRLRARDALRPRVTRA